MEDRTWEMDTGGGVRVAVGRVVQMKLVGRLCGGGSGSGTGGWWEEEGSKDEEE